LKVGGYFGYKTCNATTEYALSTNIVNPGDTITIDFNCDNTLSRHKIEMFKFKLFRKCIYKFEKKSIETSEYI
jgi:hypothetical protein